jgi:hypothetical protein
LPSPTIDFYCITDPNDKIKIELKGTLYLEETSLSNTSILVSYSMGENSWVYLTSLQTDSDGNFAFTWTPHLSGNYQLRVETKATVSMNEAANTINLFITLPTAEKPTENLFALNSNSTVEQFNFDSTTKVLSFTVQGALGTTGYVNFYIPKTGLDNISRLKIIEDGVEVPFKHESIGATWQISFFYSHSTHKITIELDHFSDYTTESTDWLCVSFVASWLMIMMTTIAIALVTLKPRQHT